MINNSIYPEHKLYTAFALIGTLSGIKMDEERFLEFSHIALKQIGYNVDIIKTKVLVEEEGTIHIPYDSKTIIAVSDDEGVFDSWEYSQWSDGYISYNRMGNMYKDLSPRINEGMRSFVNYNFIPPNVIMVDPILEEEELYVLSRAVIVDEDGLPMITFKQARAIAYYCLYMNEERKEFAGIQTVNLPNLRNKALNAMADARVPESVTDNQIDQVLDHKVSFGRKTFNKPHNWS
jgi:hypothetical protein